MSATIERNYKEKKANASPGEIYLSLTVSMNLTGRRTRIDAHLSYFQDIIQTKSKNKNVVFHQIGSVILSLLIAGSNHEMELTVSCYVDVVQYSISKEIGWSLSQFKSLLQRIKESMQVSSLN